MDCKFFLTELEARQIKSESRLPALARGTGSWKKSEFKISWNKEPLYRYDLLKEMNSRMLYATGILPMYIHCIINFDKISQKICLPMKLTIDHSFIQIILAKANIYYFCLVSPVIFSVRSTYIRIRIRITHSYKYVALFEEYARVHAAKPQRTHRGTSQGTLHQASTSWKHP